MRLLTWDRSYSYHLRGSNNLSFFMLLLSILGIEVTVVKLLNAVAVLLFTLTVFILSIGFLSFPKKRTAASETSHKQIQIMLPPVCLWQAFTFSVCFWFAAAAFSWYLRIIGEHTFQRHRRYLGAAAFY
jgi:hypothetical protein